MHNSPLLDLPLPDSSDVPDVPTHLANIVTPLEERAIIPCTSATRPTPVLGMTVFETDTKLTRVYDGTRWILPGVGVCTSGTRPGQTYVGMTVFETDTGNMMTYCGAAIGWCPPWNTSWGMPANGQARGSYSGITSAQEVTIVQATFTSVGHRRYEITAKGTWRTISGRNLIATSRITDNANTPKDNSFVNQIAAALEIGRYSVSHIYTDVPAAGSVTYKLRGICAAGLTMDFDDAQILVKDIGPASSVP